MRIKDKIGKEIWKTISDFPDYEISTYGRVRNLKGLLIKVVDYTNLFLYKEGKLDRVPPSALFF